MQLLANCERVTLNLQVITCELCNDAIEIGKRGFRYCGATLIKPGRDVCLKKPALHGKGCWLNPAAAHNEQAHRFAQSRQVVLDHRLRSDAGKP